LHKKYLRQEERRKEENRETGGSFTLEEDIQIKQKKLGGPTLREAKIASGVGWGGTLLTLEDDDGTL
jgi:hypothetical protein